MTYFRTHNESGTLTAIKDLANKTLEVKAGHWYSVKLVVDLDNGKQSIIIFDRDTQELLSYSEYTNKIDNNKIIQNQSMPTKQRLRRAIPTTLLAGLQKRH